MRRTIFKLLLFLLAGAIINVAVAWGFSLLLQAGPRFLGVSEENTGDGFVLHFVSIGSASTVVQRSYSSVSLVTELSYPPTKADLPYWYSHYRAANLPRAARDIQIGWGWPSESVGLLVLEKIKFSGSDPQFTTVSIPGLTLLPRSSGQWVEEYQSCISTCWLDSGDDPSVNLASNTRFRRSLPLNLLWPGFAINTIFYAAVLWMLFALPGAVRRRLRHKRGQCASCGYSLRECISDKCPECGTSHPS